MPDFNEDDVERDELGRFGSGGGSSTTSTKKPDRNTVAREAGGAAGKGFAKALLAGAGRFEEGVKGAGEGATAAADEVIHGSLDPRDAFEAGRMAFSTAGGEGGKKHESMNEENEEEERE